MNKNIVKRLFKNGLSFNNNKISRNRHCEPKTKQSRCFIKIASAASLPRNDAIVKCFLLKISNLIPLLAFLFAVTAAFGQLGSVRYFAYQIQGLDEPGAIDSIVNSRYDMVILEPTRTERDMEDFDAVGMVAAIKASPGTMLSNKIVLAYIDIGQAEDWRYYWEPWWEPPTVTEYGNPDFMVTMDPDGWEGCYPVAFWDTRWQNIMVNDDSSMLKKTIADGFDGIYMDWVEAYDDEYVMARADSDGVEPANEMIDFIEMIRDTARHYNPNFVVIAQNAADLCDDHPEYFDVIDGIAQEDLNFYGDGDVDWGDPDGGDKLQDSTYKAYLVTKLDLYLANDLPVFTVDYALIPANIDSAYSFSNSKGYVPFVTQTSLSQLPSYTPPGYVDIEKRGDLPDEPELVAYPNPFNSAVTIELRGVGATVRSPGQIAAEIFDISGRLVGNLPLSRTKSGNMTGGYLENRNPDLVRDPTPVIWQPNKSIPSGIYLVRAKIGEKSIVRRVLYTK